MIHKGIIVAIVAFLSVSSACAGPLRGTSDVDAYFRPYAATNNFSGSVLIMHGDTVAFAKSYGFADRSNRIPNRLDTRFHIASLSILFTSTAVLRLIDQGKLSFDAHVSEIVPGVPNGSIITIRELLDQNSGLPDVNDLADYDKLLTTHQTPSSLVAKIRGLPPFSRPGGKSLREEHSGQNLLALIIERKTGLPFEQAMKTEVFDPFGMHESGADDDSPITGPVARGNQLIGPFGLKDAPAIHWSAKSGNGSAYTTVFDEYKWLQGILAGNLLSENSRKAMLETTNGYGWDHVPSARLGETVYETGGRSPGFSSFMMYLPNEDITIIALTNIENAANPALVLNLAALLRGKPYQRFDYRYVSPATAGFPSGAFVFGKDFYRPSATLGLVSGDGGVTLNRPGGPAAPLLAVGRNKFIDRYYWIDVTVVRRNDGCPIVLDYGKFRGKSVRRCDQIHG